MKKKFFFLLIGIFLLMNGEILKSQPSVQCQFGEVQITKYVMVNVGGNLCQYKIILCVLCPAGTGQPQFNIRLAAYVPSPINCGFDDSAAKDAISAIIFDPDWISQNIATDCFAGWGPCPENTRTIVCETPKCWTKVGYYDDETIWRVIRIACYQPDVCSCKITKIICWNPQTQNFDIQVIPDPDNIINCCPETGIPSDPAEGNETPVGCYYLPCSQ